MFSEIGQVAEVFLPTDRATDRPRGFAFVEFSDSATVSAAIEKFDGVEFQGRALRVSEARERAPRTPDFSDSPWGGGHRPKPSRPKGSRRNIRSRKRGF